MKIYVPIFFLGAIGAFAIDGNWKMVTQDGIMLGTGVLVHYVLRFLYARKRKPFRCQ